MALKQSDREWLAGKLLEPTADDAKTAQQKAYVKESLYQALDEVERAKREGRKLKISTIDEFDRRAVVPVEAEARLVDVVEDGAELAREGRDSG